MSSSRILTPFFDLKERSIGQSGFFFLEHILRARIELHLESAENTRDQEMNVYIAGLLNSLLFNGSSLQQKPYISPFDQDIQKYLECHAGLRNAYRVYRENADVGLLLSGLFDGHTHNGSYHRKVFSLHDETGRIALYYEFAASALAHLQGNNNSLVEVLEELSAHIDMIVKIIHYAAGYYFDMLERISDGSMYHLGREIDGLELQKQYQQKLDEFLKVYSRYIEQPSEEGKATLLTLAEEIRTLKNDFKFDL